MKHLTHEHVRFYTTQGKELNPNSKLQDVCAYKTNGSLEFQRFILDFKNVLVLKLFCQNEFIFVPFDNKVSDTRDLLKHITSENLDRVQKHKDFANLTKDSSLDLVYHHQILLSTINLHDHIPKGPSSSLIIDVIMSRMVGKKQVHIQRLDQKWMALEFMSKVYHEIPKIVH